MADFRYAVDAAGAVIPDYGTDSSDLSTSEQSNLGSTAWAEDFTGLDEAIARQAAENAAGGGSSTQTVGGTGGGESANYRKNPLDDFVNYTYGITLSATQPGSFGTEDQVMIASGGRRENRAPEFFEDFYFEGCQMTTVIGMNAKTRSSNVIDIKFTVIEPYGITLLNRILDLAKRLDIENWTEMSFVLRIDFYGNDESGMPAGPLDGQTKYIPVKIIACEVKASHKGSEYKFTAIPWHHLAFQQTAGSTHGFVEVTAKKVEDFFNGDGETDGSYKKALNDYQKKLLDDKYIAVKDEYEFEIDDEIGSAELVTVKEKNHPSHIPMADDKNSKAKTSDGIKAAQGVEVPAILDQEKQSIAINAGTSIIDVINQTIRNSKYIVDQVGKSSNGTVKWYRIVSKVEKLDYDEKRKTYAKKYIYRVLKSEIHNTKYPDAPLSKPTVAHKRYNYIYTGDNQQILDFSLDFNVMFYTAITAHRYKLKKADASPEPVDPEKKDNDQGVKNNTKEGDITPSQIKIVPAQTDVSTPHQGANDVKNTSANDLYKSMMSTSRGDMINVRLKITGDPEFIKQDDVAYESTGTVGEIDSYGSLTSDGGELYVDLFFRSPRDIDQSTGMYDFSNWQEAAFNGRYRVITVDNVFERGQFIQTLNLVRIFNQEDFGAGSGGGGPSSSLADSATPQGVYEMSEAEAANEVQRMLNRSQSIPSSGGSSSAAKETSSRADAGDTDSTENSVANLQNQFSNLTPEDVSQWNLAP